MRLQGFRHPVWLTFWQQSVPCSVNFEVAKKHNPHRRKMKRKMNTYGNCFAHLPERFSPCFQTSHHLEARSTNITIEFQILDFGNGNHFVGDAGRNFWAMSDLQVSTACVVLVRCLKPSLVSTGDEAGPAHLNAVALFVWPLWLFFINAQTKPSVLDSLKIWTI